MHDGERINARSQVIHHNASAFGQPLQLPYGKRLPHIEYTEKYKAREEGFPTEGNGNERDQLSGDFIDDNELRIFRSGCARDQRGGRDSDRVTTAAATIVAHVRLVTGVCELASDHTITVATDPHVPGPGLRRPAPKKVATRVAHSGARD